MEKVRRARQFKREPWSVFADTAKALGLGHGALCEKLGYGPASLSDWEKAGDIPAVAALACRYLSAGKVTTVVPRIWVVYITDDAQKAVLDTVARGLGLAPAVL